MISNELPFMSVIIPTLNTVKTVKKAIDAVLIQKYPKDKFEIIVVDGGSSDGTYEILQQYPVKLILQTNDFTGDSGARNMGAISAKGKIIVTTDADDEVDKNWLINIAQGYNRSDVGGVIGSSHIVYDKDNFQEKIFAELFICFRGSDKVKSTHNNNDRLKTNISIGPNQSFRKDVFFRIGGFDMGLSSGMDLDILWRIEKAGYKINFVNNAVVYKKSRANLKEYFRQAYTRSRQGAIIYCKHPQKIYFNYILNILFVPTIVFLIFMWVYSDFYVFLILSFLASFSPIIYFSLRLMKTRQIINNWSDRFIILIIGYFTMIVSSISILIGFYDYLLTYNEKLLKDRKGLQ